MRVAAVDAYGQAQNLYSHRARLSAASPSAPWAVHLTDTSGAFRLLCFDLDAHHGPDGGADDDTHGAAAQRDTTTLTALLESVGIEHVVCASGPSGGRHVWLALTTGADAGQVASLARLARQVCPSVDIAPLSNPATGCVRPPGSPHRTGGTSVVLAGDTAALVTPTTTPEQLDALTVALVTALGPATPPAPAEAGHHTAAAVVVDELGHPHLPGPRRALPTPSKTALHAAAGTDASGALWTMLLGAVCSRWRHRDIAALVSTAPGLEHARTTATPTGRTPRPPRGPASTASVLARQWAKAVAHVASTGRRTGEDPTFDARAGHLAAVVRNLQATADATPGYWTSATGPAQRRVLDALCTYALRAVRPDVQADVRRLAIATGIGRESARTALHALAAQGWIERTDEAHGMAAARWTITPAAVIHSSTATNRSQAVPRPRTTPTSPSVLAIAGVGSAERTAALAQLTARITGYAHDVFTAGALGFAAGNAYATLTTTTANQHHTSDATRPLPRRLLQRLAAEGLVTGGPSTWTPAHLERRDVVAAAHGATGTLAGRARAYGYEREAWAWWQAEAAWMSAPTRTSDTRRAGAGQLTLVPTTTTAYPAHPRRGDGRADYAAARAAVIARDEDQQYTGVSRTPRSWPRSPLASPAAA